MIKPYWHFILLSILVALSSCGQSGGISPALTIIDGQIAACTSCKFFFATEVSGGNLGGIAGADNICNTSASKPDNRPYKAFLSDGSSRVACSTGGCSGGTSEHVDWVLKPNTNYYRSDGVTFVAKTNANGIFDFTLTNAPHYDTNSINWTGLMFDWRSSPFSCVSWTSSNNADTADSGSAGETNFNVIYKNTINCDSNTANHGILCVEQ